MTSEVNFDPELTDAQEVYNRRQTLLAEAMEYRENASGRLGTFIADKLVKHRHRTLFHSDEHLGMVEAMRAIKEGVPVETVIRDLDY